MKRMMLLFSHELTEEQKKEAENGLGCREFVKLSDELQDVWSNVPSECDDIKPLAEKIILWLEENSKTGDCVLIQGDFGMSFMVAEWSLENRRIPLYSTTEREHSAVKSGETVINVHSFRHVKFRRYVSYTQKNCLR